MSFNFTYNYPKVAKDSGFKLRNYKDGPLDWRLIGSLEVERILRDQSLEQIDAVLNHLSEAPLGSILESNILDSGIAKYFILSQFSVQYLLFCRKFLEETVTDLRESHGISQMELATAKRSLSEANNEILQLHKKITQMEAIHEVIYPCHLCTKNFVSNDALNLHITRKHNSVLGKSEKRLETQAKDRENDLTLINTIKLELEIKQLKERLNNAEREIKEKHIETEIKNVAPSTRAVTTDRIEKILVQSIGIQSNLSEIKEKDDNSEDDLSTSSQGRHQLNMLEEKLLEFDKWKEEQKNQNSEFLTEINDKLGELSIALEATRKQKEQYLENGKQCSMPTIENFEVLLNKKLEDIGKSNAEKLEQVVNKMELDYKKKLDQLEKELIKLNEKTAMQKNSKSNEKVERDKRELKEDSIKSLNETFEIKPKVDNQHPNKIEDEIKIITSKSQQELKEASVSESNHTFVKYKDISQLEKEHNKSISSSISDDDSTDISDTFLDEENLDILKSENRQTKKEHVPKKDTQSVKLEPVKPKIVTKKDVKKLTNHRLQSLGVDMKTKTLTPALKKRISSELNDKRNKLKQKHPQFYATRNKIKKFVDKLCSTKMPPNAEALLKATKHKPLIQDKNQHYDNDLLTEEEEEDELPLKVTNALNTNTSTVDNNSFKQRLDRILASPIMKPEKRITQVQVHHNKPVPMPRKRVMFNQPERQELHVDPSLTATESDESFERRKIN